MYLNTTVEIPDIPGKIVIQKKGDSNYVHYEYDRVYDEKRRFNIPKRVLIGKVADGNKMYPNPNFLKYFPSVDIPVYPLEKVTRTFYPRKTKFIPASSPYKSGTEYKISVGDEQWEDGTFQTVVKVQMVYDGKVVGRMCPSYPIHSNDWNVVQAVVDELIGENS